MPSIKRLLKHRVSIVRATATGDESDWNQPVQDWGVVASDVPALIQERTGREVALSHEAGPVVITALTFFDKAADITERDRIYRPATGRTYEVLYVKDAAGWGHHWQVDCRLVEAGGLMPYVVGFQPSRTKMLAEAAAAAKDAGLGIEDGGQLAEAIRAASAELLAAAEETRDASRAGAGGRAPEPAPVYTNPWDPPPAPESW